MKIEVASSIQRLPLHDCHRNVHSQCGEDGIIEYLLRLLDIRDGYFVEFGAWDGRHLSNCAHLADQGWSGCFIEGEGERFAELRRNYESMPNITAVNAFVTVQGQCSLTAILDSYRAPLEPTIMSIDIDGMDFHVWESLTIYRPILCIVEFNPTIPANICYVQENNATVNRGASLRALWQLALRKGYALVAATSLNGFFMREDVCNARSVPCFSPEQVKDTQYETYLFQGYDGTLFTAGARNLLWHGITIGETELQVLPPELRRYPPTGPDFYSEALLRFRRAREA